LKMGKLRVQDPGATDEASRVQVDLWEVGQTLVVQPEQVDGMTLYQTNGRFL